MKDFSDNITADICSILEYDEEHDELSEHIRSVVSHIRYTDTDAVPLRFPLMSTLYLVATPLGNLDGLESDGSGGYIASDYLKGKLFHVTAAGEAREIRRFKPGAADIGFVPTARIVLVPHMNENQVAAYDVSADLR